MYTFRSYYDRGFTLIEILVVITLLVILSGVVIANLSGTSAEARDAKRQSDLRNLQNAIETYKNENGRYPRQATSTALGNNGWSGQVGTNFRPDDGSGQYIVGLAPEYIPVLPTDPKLNRTTPANSGYVYRTNAEGTVYKLKAHRTVETDTMTHLHPYKACDIRVAHLASGALSSGTTTPEVIGWCGRTQYAGPALPNTCRSNFEDWSISYGLWGGFAPLNGFTSLDGLTNNQKIIAFDTTTTVICR